MRQFQQATHGARRGQAPGASDDARVPVAAAAAAGQKTENTRFSLVSIAVHSGFHSAVQVFIGLSKAPEMIEASNVVSGLQGARDSEAAAEGGACEYLVEATLPSEAHTLGGAPSTVWTKVRLAVQVRITRPLPTTLFPFFYIGH